MNFVCFGEVAHLFPLQCFQTWRERRGRNNLARHQMCLGGVNDAGDKLNDFVLLGRCFNICMSQQISNLQILGKPTLQLYINVEILNILKEIQIHVLLF